MRRYDEEDVRPIADADIGPEWTAHDGGPQPVGDDERVCVIVPEGELVNFLADCTADCFDWSEVRFWRRSGWR